MKVVCVPHSLVAWYEREHLIASISRKKISSQGLIRSRSITGIQGKCWFPCILLAKTVKDPSIINIGGKVNPFMMERYKLCLRIVTKNVWSSLFLLTYYESIYDTKLYVSIIFFIITWINIVFKGRFTKIKEYFCSKWLVIFKKWNKS